MWITNLAVLFGAELNAELERSRELEAGEPAEEEIQLPPRSAAPKDKATRPRSSRVEHAGVRLRALRAPCARGAAGPAAARTDSRRT